MKISKKFWWILIGLVIAVIVFAYFYFQPGIEQTALSGTRDAMSGGTLLK